MQLGDRTDPYLPDLLSCIIIVACGLIFTTGLQSILDVWLYDESYYLHTGRNLFDPVVHDAPLDAPSYEAWYFLMSQVQGDPIKLYYLNYKLQTIFLPLALFVVLRGCKTYLPIALSFSLVFLFSNANLPVWPKVSHFALAVAFAGIFLSFLPRDWEKRFLVAAPFALISSYARPEFFLTAVMLLAFALTGFVRICVRRGAKGAGAASAAFFSVLAIFAITLVTMGSPVGSSNRSLMAFGQHYAVNFVEWNADDRNPWTNWTAIVDGEFNSPSSVLDALMANPSAFARHVISNITRVPNVVGNMMRPFHATGTSLVVTLIAIVVITALGARYYLNHRGAKFAISIRTPQPEEMASAVTLAAFVFPAVISPIVIYPRDHYLMMIILLMLVLCTLLVRAAFSLHEKHWGGWSERFLVMVCLSLALVYGSRPASFSISVQRDNVNTISYIRSLGLEDPIVMLEAEGGYCIYITSLCERVAEYAKDEDFLQFLDNRAINMIVLSQTLLGDTRFADDPSWQSFLRNPGRYGFELSDIPRVSGRKLLMSSQLTD